MSYATVNEDGTVTDGRIVIANQATEEVLDGRKTSKKEDEQAIEIE